MYVCHPEEPQAVLSATREGSPEFVEITTAEILRFAQNDSVPAFFRKLLVILGQWGGRCGVAAWFSMPQPTPGNVNRGASFECRARSFLSRMA